jgi:hypothetical protein
MYLAGAGATAVFMNISAATCIRTSAAWVAQISVIATGTAGGIFDAAATGTATSGRQIGVIPAIFGVYTWNLPCTSGVTVVPGAGQVLTVTLA